MIKRMVKKQIKRLEEELRQEITIRDDDTKEYLASELWEAVYDIRQRFKELIADVEDRNKVFKNIDKNLVIIKRFLIDLAPLPHDLEKKK